MVACAACVVLCKIASSLLWKEMERQNMQADPVHPPPPPITGRGPWNIGPVRLTVSNHRKYYPNSKLSYQWKAAEYLTLAAAVIAALTFFLHM